MGDVCDFLGAEGLSVSEELNGANDGETNVQIFLNCQLFAKLAINAMRKMIISYYSSIIIFIKAFDQEHI